MVTTFNRRRNQTVECLRKVIYAIISYLQDVVCRMILAHTFLFIHSPVKRNKLLWIARVYKFQKKKCYNENKQCSRSKAELAKTERPLSEIEGIFQNERERTAFMHAMVFGISFFFHQNFTEVFVDPKSNFSNEDIVNYSTYLVWQGFPLRNIVTDVKWWRFFRCRRQNLKQSCVNTKMMRGEMCLYWNGASLEATSILAALINEIQFDQLSERHILHLTLNW